MGRCQGSPCPNPAVAMPAPLLLRAAKAACRGDLSVRVACFIGRVAAAWPKILGCGSLPSLWLPATQKCSVHQVSLLALCILSQQLASDSGVLPENGYAGCSCKRVTAPAAGTRPPQPRRVPLPGQAPHRGGVQGGGGPEEPLPPASGLATCPSMRGRVCYERLGGARLLPANCAGRESPGRILQGRARQPRLPAPPGNVLFWQTW